MKTKKSVSEDVAQKIALRAYFIWENEGRPEGREHAHWQMAEAEILSVPPAKKAAAPESPAPKKALAQKPGAAADKKPAGNGAAKKAPGGSPKTPAKAVKPKAGKAKKSASPDA